MGHYLFEEPWPVAVMLGCVAFALLLAGMRGKRKMLIGAGVAAIAAAGVVVLAMVVTTQREVVEQRTRDLVAATSPIDLPKLRSMIDDSAAVTLPNGVMLPLRLALSDELAGAVDRHAIKETTISGLYVQMQSDTTAEARLRVRSVVPGQSYGPVNTQWLLTWRRPAGEDWRIVAVEWLKFENQEPTAALWN